MWGKGPKSQFDGQNDGQEWFDAERVLRVGLMGRTMVRSDFDVGGGCLIHWVKALMAVMGVGMEQSIMVAPGLRIEHTISPFDG